MHTTVEQTWLQSFWRGTPPALFPPLLGSLGIGLAWRQASVQFGLPGWIAEVFLSGVIIIFAFVFSAYCAKIFTRFNALNEDLQNIPGRAGLPAASACFFLIAAAIIPLAPILAKAMLILGLVLHGCVAVLTARVLLTNPKGLLRVTPVWHLTFVSFIIAPVAAVPLGWDTLSDIIYATTLPIALAIWSISLLQMCRGSVPAPLRPLLAIHMAPLGLFTIVSALMGHEQAAVGFGWLLLTGGCIYLIGIRYLVVAGFSPAWGAFTFPMAAFANAMFCIANFIPMPFRAVAGLEMIAATVIIGIVAFKTGRMAMSDALSKLTQASQV